MQFEQYLLHFGDRVPIDIQLVPDSVPIRPNQTRQFNINPVFEPLFLSVVLLLHLFQHQNSVFVVNNGTELFYLGQVSIWKLNSEVNGHLQSYFS